MRKLIVINAIGFFFSFGLALYQGAGSFAFWMFLFTGVLFALNVYFIQRGISRMLTWSAWTPGPEVDGIREGVVWVYEDGRVAQGNSRVLAMKRLDDCPDDRAG